MTTLRSIALCSVLLAACNPDAPAQSKADAAPTDAAPATKAPGTLPAKRLPPGDPHAEPPPGEEPPAPANVVPSAKGTFDVTRDGKVTHFARLAPGQNRAIVLPNDGSGRVSLGAAETDEGLPHLRIIIDGFRPDQATYPVIIDSKAAAPAKTEAKAEAPAKAGPSLTVRYELSELRVYVLDAAKGADMQVTLEGFEGSTLRGRFEGKLAPTAAGLGDPIPLSGKFAVELGLQGVAPGPTAPAP